VNQRTLLYTLLGSIVLNAFLLGIISVHAFSRRSSFGGRGHVGPDSAADAVGERRGQRLFRELVRAAGGPSDPRVRALWSGQRQHLGELHQALSSSREQVLTALEQEPFDREALARALRAAEEARLHADHVATEGVLNLAATLSPAERKTLRNESNATPIGPRGGAHRRQRDRAAD
jgi:uncharacterized membrane protein